MKLRTTEDSDQRQVRRFKPHHQLAWSMNEIILGAVASGASRAECLVSGGLQERLLAIRGDVANPTYEQVCGKRTGHAEVVKVVFDPSVIDLTKILRVFFALHDPTQVNRQGNDVGPQYRTCIFYSDESQKTTINQVISQIQPTYGSPIATEVEPAKAFWPAEDYHHDYFERNRISHTAPS